MPQKPAFWPWVRHWPGPVPSLIHKRHVILILSKKAEQTRQANVIAAEGDARAADLIGKALGEAGDGKFSDILCFSFSFVIFI